MGAGWWRTAVPVLALEIWGGGPCGIPRPCSRHPRVPARSTPRPGCRQLGVPILGPPQAAVTPRSPHTAPHAQTVITPGSPYVAPRAWGGCHPGVPILGTPGHHHPEIPRTPHPTPGPLSPQGSLHPAPQAVVTPRSPLTAPWTRAAVTPRSPACRGVAGTPRPGLLLQLRSKNQPWKRSEVGPGAKPSVPIPVSSCPPLPPKP